MSSVSWPELRRFLALAAGAFLIFAAIVGVLANRKALSTDHEHPRPAGEFVAPAPTASGVPDGQFRAGADACTHCWQTHMGYARRRCAEKVWFCIDAECCLAMDRAASPREFAEALCLMADGEELKGAGFDRARVLNLREAAAGINPGSAAAHRALLTSASDDLESAVQRLESTGEGTLGPAFRDLYGLLERRIRRAADARHDDVEAGPSRLDQEVAKARVVLERARQLLARAENPAAWQPSPDADAARCADLLKSAEATLHRGDWPRAKQLASLAIAAAPDAERASVAFCIRGEASLWMRPEKGGASWREALSDLESALDADVECGRAQDGLLAQVMECLDLVSAPDSHEKLRADSRLLRRIQASIKVEEDGDESCAQRRRRVVEAERKLIAAQVRVARASWTQASDLK